MGIIAVEGSWTYRASTSLQGLRRPVCLMSARFTIRIVSRGIIAMLTQALVADVDQGCF